MKRIILLALLSLVSLRADNMRITVTTAGTPVQLWSTAKRVNSLMVQYRSGTTGTVYVMCQIPAGTTPATTNGAHVTAELTSVGMAYSDWVEANSGKVIDVSQCWIDSSVSGATAIVTFSPR